CADTTVPPLPQGEPRVEARLGGDEVTAVVRYIFVPEAWDRQQRAAATRNIVVQIGVSIVFGGLLLSAAIAGTIAWSRGRYSPRAFVMAAAIVLAVSIVGLANSWPAVLAGLSTAAPLSLQLGGVVALGAIGLTILAAMVGLAIGA